MAEYTIPKPYRDFYVTSPICSIENSLNDLKEVISRGYIKTDIFSGHNDKYIHFSDSKHGFSITNEGKSAIPSTLSLRSSVNWEQGSLNSDTGNLVENENVITTKNFIPLYNGGTHTFTIVANDDPFTFSLFFYDENLHFIDSLDWQGSTVTISSDTVKPFVKLCIKRISDAPILPNDLFSESTSFNMTINVSAITNNTVKISEVIEEKPKTLEEWLSIWEQGDIAQGTGIPTSSQNAIRTTDFMNVESDTTYLFNIDLSSNAVYIYLREYKENGDYIGPTSLTSTGIKQFRTSQETKKIKFSISQKPSTNFSPTDLYSLITDYRITKEQMIVQEGDTRIITMPSFDVLHIESDIPYHGHALDLAE